MNTAVSVVDPCLLPLAFLIELLGSLGWSVGGWERFARVRLVENDFAFASEGVVAE